MKIRHYFERPSDILESILIRIGGPLPDRLYLKWLYRLKTGCKLNLAPPKTFNEKLQWLKLYNRRSEYTTMVDKYAVKGYVEKIIGKDYIIPTLGVWDKPDEIDWNSLPNKFVLKTTHDSGGVVICKDINKFDKKVAIKKLKYALTHDNYSLTREWPYKNVPRRILAEEYMEGGDGQLKDYKFFCFDGIVKALFVATDRQNPNEEVKFDFFDADFNFLPVRQGHDHAKVLPQRPQCFEEMKRIAEQLSSGIPHVRVDLYDVNGKVFFGELTFFHFGGFMPFEPKEWDVEFGNYLNLLDLVNRL